VIPQIYIAKLYHADPPAREQRTRGGQLPQTVVHGGIILQKRSICFLIVVSAEPGSWRDRVRPRGGECWRGAGSEGCERAVIAARR